MLPVEVPPLRVNTTVLPPTTRKLPAASFATTVKVIWLPLATFGLDTWTNDCEATAVPGVTVTVGSVVVTGVPETEAEIVAAVPETTPVKLPE